MSGVRDCETDGFFAGDECPVCGERGRQVLSDRRRTRLSKFLSGALRHFPSDAGLSLDEAGWTPYGDLLDAATGKYDWADEESVAVVVATDPKGRFERDGDRVRAAYGHSADVSLEPTDAPVPDVLYHGTAPENVESILGEGLRPMGRQKVHLSASPASAREVGERHAADPTILRVDAAAMLSDGRRVTKRGRDTYTTDRVPPEYLSVAER